MQFLEELQAWWQAASPETQTLVQQGGILLVVILAGHFVGGLVARKLRGRNFDAALRLPGGAGVGTDGDHQITPTFLIGVLVRLTVWAGAAWWVANNQGRVELAGSIALVVGRVWAIVGMLIVVLALGNMLAQRLVAALEGLKANGAGSHGNQTQTHRSVAGAVGAGAYVLITLIVLLVAADFFDWPLTRSSTQGLWQLAQRLLTALTALGIGYLGATWARELALQGVSADRKPAHYTALGIICATTVLVVAMLLSSAGVLVGLVALAVLGVALWLVRSHLPDLSAGLQLRTNRIHEVWFDGNVWQVADVGLLSTQVTRNGAVYRVPNRQVLEARFQPAVPRAEMADQRS